MSKPVNPVRTVPIHALNPDCRAEYEAMGHVSCTNCNATGDAGPSGFPCGWCNGFGYFEVIDTTQTQVTGPVDDAIDAEVQRLITRLDEGHDNEAFGEPHEWAMWREEVAGIARSLTARLAPRADALIEREQVRKALKSAHSEWLQGPPIDDTDPKWQELTKSLLDYQTDQIMALLPRAPMPEWNRTETKRWVVAEAINNEPLETLSRDEQHHYLRMADRAIAALGLDQ